MARSFLSTDADGASVDVVADPGESWPGMLGLEMSSLDRACADTFRGVVRDLARGQASADELRRVRERRFFHVREWKDGIPKELIAVAAARVVDELGWG